MKPLVILAALDLESRAIARALGLRRVSPECFGLGGGGVQVWTIGMRGVEAPEGLGLSGGGPFLLAGLGGGLDPALRTGDLVVDGETADVVAAIGARSGRVHTADRVVGSVGEKAELFRRTGAAVVDMETDVVRAAAGGRVVTLRAVCDPAEVALSPALAGCVDAFGRPRAGRLASEVARRPSLVVELLRLRRLSSAALESLGRGVERYVRAAAGHRAVDRSVS